jgi:hypothetical protein
MFFQFFYVFLTVFCTTASSWCVLNHPVYFKNKLLHRLNKNLKAYLLTNNES